MARLIDRVAVIANLVALSIIAGLGVWQHYHVRPLPSAVQSIKIDSPMPSFIDISGVQWAVEQVKFPDDGSMQGFTFCDIRTVQISVTAINPRDALIHELLHAAVCSYDVKTHKWDPDNLYYNSSTADKHEGIYRVAAIVSQLLARNPDLAQYEAEGDVVLGKVTVR